MDASLEVTVSRGLLVDPTEVCRAIRKYRTVGRQFKALAIACFILGSGCFFAFTADGRLWLEAEGWEASAPYFWYGVVLFFFGFVGLYHRRSCEGKWRFLSCFHRIPDLLELLASGEQRVSVADIAKMDWDGLCEVVQKALVIIARGKVIAERLKGSLRSTERIHELGVIFMNTHGDFFSRGLAVADFGVYYKIAEKELDEMRARILRENAAQFGEREASFRRKKV
ncbi:MAG: hypothetical protein PHV42_01305 [Candidatus Pacebacteria bacterium]|nr:hypothetical protein [Candidatus Paceibacterota bacterium]